MQRAYHTYTVRVGSYSHLQAFPLAQLAYSTALVALASAIIGLIAAIFFIVGASLSLSGEWGGHAQP